MNDVIRTSNERTTCWLIEHQNGGWIHGNPDHEDGFGWSFDPDRAIRFCRKADALGAMARLGFHSPLHFASEHVFMDVTAHETGERRETAWLVEDGGHTPRYRTMHDGVPVWTDNPNEALRFARRVDEELFSREDEDAWCIVEHQWITLDGEQAHTQKADEQPSPIDDAEFGTAEWRAANPESEGDQLG
jgi:hypothetical protein